MNDKAGPNVTGINDDGSISPPRGGALLGE